MKLSISNIAWDDSAGVFGILRDYGVKGIEVAPTKVWPEWKDASYENAVLYRKEMADEGFEIPALQAILFSRPDLKVFDTACHKLFLEHIDLLSDIACGLGAKVLVFGSPKNRKRGQYSMTDAEKTASDFLRKAGEICFRKECCIGIEHNPAEYGCDFVTNVADARRLVDMVNHPGIKLHLDSGGIHMCGGDILEVIKNAGEFVHYHISEPMLEPIAGGVVNHSEALGLLRKIGYSGWVSIEMKQPESFEKVITSLNFIKGLV